jgi:hypothetical protein
MYTYNMMCNFFLVLCIISPGKIWYGRAEEYSVALNESINVKSNTTISGLLHSPIHHPKPPGTGTGPIKGGKDGGNTGSSDDDDPSGSINNENDDGSSTDSSSGDDNLHDDDDDGGDDLYQDGSRDTPTLNPTCMPSEEAPTAQPSCQPRDSLPTSIPTSIPTQIPTTSNGLPISLLITPNLTSVIYQGSCRSAVSNKWYYDEIYLPLMGNVYDQTLAQVCILCYGIYWSLLMKYFIFLYLLH